MKIGLLAMSGVRAHASTVMLGERYRKREVGEVVRDIEAICRLRGKPFMRLRMTIRFWTRSGGRSCAGRSSRWD
jgi:hypothetical protein